MLASNPWQFSEKLPKASLDKTYDCASKVLVEITHFLREWPGDSTVNCDIKERHGRFVQIIGGYPLINGRFPLDWPLHSESTRALRLSRYLDTISGNEETSVRSLILELDRKERAKPKPDWIEVNRICVSSLFEALRLQDNHPMPTRTETEQWGQDSANETEEEVEEEAGEEEPGGHIFTLEEEQFLTNLHTLDSNRLARFWPWNFHIYSRIGKGATQVPDQPKTLKPDIAEMTKFGEWKKNNQGADYSEFPPSILDIFNRREAWKDYENKKKTGEAEKSFFQVIRFEYSYIQTWMSQRWLKAWKEYDYKCSECGVNPGIDGKSHKDGCSREGKKPLSDSVGQRFLRGLSALCELGMSQIRRKIISEYGVGSIIIDGGGRIEFLVPPDKPLETTNKKGVIDQIKNSYKNMFIISDRRTSYLQSELEIALKAHIGEERYIELRDLHNGSLRREYEAHLGEEFVMESLPPHRCYRVTDEKGKRCKQPLSETGTRVSNGCELCDNSPSINWPSMDKTVDNHESSLCMMHRLTYIIGNKQRLRDSVREISSATPIPPMNFDIGPQGGIEPKPNSEKEKIESAATKAQNKRSVHSICVLDGNSVGILFSKGGGSTTFTNYDLRRRKSFRFNSTWYILLCESLSETRHFGKDRVAAWVCAGDDLVLAQYGDKDGSNPLDTTLNQLASKIVNKFAETQPDFHLTFACGHAKSSIGGHNRQIRATYKEAIRLEKIAKLHWKTIAKEKFEEEYLKLPNKTIKKISQEIPLIIGEVENYSESDGHPSSITIRSAENKLDAEEQKQRPIKIGQKCFDYTLYATGTDKEIQCPNEEEE